MNITPLEVPKRAEVLTDSVLINNMELTSPDVVAGATRYADSTGREDVGDYVERAIEIGAKSMALGSATIDVDAINTAITGLSGDVSKVAADASELIRRAVEDATNADTGTLTKSVEHLMAGLSEQISDLLVGEDAPVREGIQRSVKAVTDNLGEEFHRAINVQSEAVRMAFSGDNPDSPLAEVVRTVRETAKGISDQVTELRTAVEIQKARAQTMERTAIKGADYEADVLGALGPIALAAGDHLEDTHDSVGAVAKCKAGDGVLTLGEAIARDRSIRVVIEAKDRSLSFEAWREELARSRDNRKAVAALGVIKGPEHVPGGSRVKVIDRLNILVAYDPEVDDVDLLLGALHLLRAQAACAAVEGAGDELDVAAVRVHLDAAVKLLDDFDKVERAGSAAQRGIDDMRKHASALRRDLLDRLSRGLRLIDGSGEAAA